MELSIVTTIAAAVAAVFSTSSVFLTWRAARMGTVRQVLANSVIPSQWSWAHAKVVERPVLPRVDSAASATGESHYTANLQEGQRVLDVGRDIGVGVPVRMPTYRLATMSEFYEHLFTG